MRMSWVSGLGPTRPRARDAWRVSVSRSPWEAMRAKRAVSPTVYIQTADKTGSPARHHTPDESRKSADVRWCPLHMHACTSPAVRHPMVSADWSCQSWGWAVVPAPSPLSMCRRHAQCHCGPPLRPSVCLVPSRLGASSPPSKSSCVCRLVSRMFKHVSSAAFRLRCVWQRYAWQRYVR